MEKAISNLLSNALRYSPVGSEIEITLKDKDATHLLFTIKDNGVGIPKEHQALIFDRYYQVDKESLQGTGIGLALCKEIIELHGGNILVESKTGVGSTFTFSVPWGVELAENETVIENTNANDKISTLGPLIPTTKVIVGEKSLEKMRPIILVVEDHDEVRNYIGSVLSKEAEIVKASNGREALEIAGRVSPDLIVSDIMMPEMEGLEFTELIKSEFKTSHIPVVLLTAKASMKSKLIGLKTGADDYITKPFNPEELQVRCLNLIHQRRKLRELFSANRDIVSSEIAVNNLDEIFLEKAMALVRQRLDDPEFNVKRFAQEIGVSRTNLYTKIKNLTGKNIVGFIRTLRIQKAMKLIESKAGNMNEIAFKVGFNNRQSFIKSFKLETGVTPSEYKNGQESLKNYEL